MKLTRNLIFGMMAATSAVAVAGVGVTVAQEGLGFKNAEAVTPMRRIWVVNQHDKWSGTTQGDNGVTYGNFEGYSWCTTTSEEAQVFKPIICHGEYFKGSFFFDIPAHFDRLIFRWNGWTQQTADLELPELGSQADVWYLHNDSWDNGKLRCTMGTMPMGTGQLQYLMGLYDTCSDSLANGYMAYPQIMANFVTPSTGADLTEGVYSGAGEQGYEGKLPTIQEKLDAMRLKYEAATK